MTTAQIKGALETALCTVAGIQAIASSSVASATVITTALPHGIPSGVGVPNQLVSIVGHTGSTPAIDGTYHATVTGANTFTIPKAVTVAGSGGGVTQTSWLNVDFTPPDAQTPFQIATIEPATPDNAEYGASSMAMGIFYVRLQYPLNQGTAAVLARAELIKAKFYRTASFAAGASTVVIGKTPFDKIIGVELDRFAVLITIPFHSYQGA